MNYEDMNYLLKCQIKKLYLWKLENKLLLN